jgi:hypothetical protein
MSRERTPDADAVAQAPTVASGPPPDPAEETASAGGFAGTTQDFHPTWDPARDGDGLEGGVELDDGRGGPDALDASALDATGRSGGDADGEDGEVPAHRAVTVLARPGAPAQGEAPPVEAAALLAHGDTLSERELSPRAARGSGSPVLPAAGARLGGARYQARGEIGRGGMGRVLEAHDRRLDRVVAIKESFATDVDGRQRFEREVAITARLEHPSIVPLYDSGVTADGRAYYVMRKLSGRGLDLVMAELSSLDERLALLPALLAACDAVAHAHARRVVHRDLKPGNILIGDHGETMVID